MGKFSELNLEWWQEDDLEDLEEKYQVSEKSVDEIQQLIKDFRAEAESKYAEVCRLENEADMLYEYLNIINK